MGRKSIPIEERAKYQLIAIDPRDYHRIKVHSIETKTPIKIIVNKLVQGLD